MRWTSRGQIIHAEKSRPFAEVDRNRPSTAILDARCRSTAKERLPSARLLQYLPVDRRQRGCLINLRAEAERLRLSYAVRAGDGAREDVVDTISVLYLRCRFGGSRAYWLLAFQ